jgi:hypothetical protein
MLYQSDVKYLVCPLVEVTGRYGLHQDTVGEYDKSK